MPGCALLTPLACDGHHRAFTLLGKPAVAPGVDVVGKPAELTLEWGGVLLLLPHQSKHQSLEHRHLRE